MTESANHLNPETLSAFIDGELPLAEAHAVELHMAVCHACTLRALSAMLVKAATTRAGQRFAAPSDAMARLTAQLQGKGSAPAQQPKQSARVYTFRPLAWSGVAAALVLSGSLFVWQQGGQGNALSAELLDQHLATLASGASPEVISTDRHTVKPWFQGRLPFSFNLPDAANLPPATVLKGADLAFVRDQPAALLLFTIHAHEVSIFVLQREHAPDMTRLPKGREGFAIHSATTGDLSLIAVSDVNPAELDSLMAAVVRAQTPQ